LESAGAPGAPGFDGNTAALSNTAARDGAPAPAPAPDVTKTVRTFFPETWLWDLVDVK